MGTEKPFKSGVFQQVPCSSLCLLLLPLWISAVVRSEPHDAQGMMSLSPKRHPGNHQPLSSSGSLPSALLLLCYIWERTWEPHAMLQHRQHSFEGWQLPLGMKQPQLPQASPFSSHASARTGCSASRTPQGTAGIAWSPLPVVGHRRMTASPFDGGAEELC